MAAGRSERSRFWSPETSRVVPPRPRLSLRRLPTHHADSAHMTRALASATSTSLTNARPLASTSDCSTSRTPASRCRYPTTGGAAPTALSPRGISSTPSGGAPGGPLKQPRSRRDAASGVIRQRAHGDRRCCFQALAVLIADNRFDVGGGARLTSAMATSGSPDRQPLRDCFATNGVARSYRALRSRRTVSRSKPAASSWRTIMPMCFWLRFCLP